MSDEQKKPGLRFEVTKVATSAENVIAGKYVWQWRLIGAEGIVCLSPPIFNSEAEARSHIAKNRGRLKAAGRAKVLTA